MISQSILVETQLLIYRRTEKDQEYMWPLHTRGLCGRVSFSHLFLSRSQESGS